MPKSPLNFAQVEALRTHMLLSVAHMAKLLTVSRVTYSGWVSGKPMRKANDTKVRGLLRKMMAVMTDQEWPKPEHIAMTPAQRFNTLLELMNQQD